MSKFFRTSSVLLKHFGLVTLVFAMAGCGDVDWFPAYERLPTTPDQFSFPGKTGVALNTTVTSDPITVSGLTGATSPVSVTGSVGSNSKYAINGAAATNAAGTVKNGDRVTVSHTSANAVGTSTISTLSIGTVNGSFTSRTQTVATPAFTTPVSVGQFVQVNALLVASDLSVHEVSIKDTLNSGNAVYALGDDSGNPTIFSNAERTFAGLNGQRIFVRNLPSATNVTTLTIDGVDFTVNLAQP